MWAKTCLSVARIIRARVLFEYIDVGAAAAKIAATHLAGSHLLRLATAFGPSASVDSQSPNRAF
jgi:hypothetical protein